MKGVNFAHIAITAITESAEPSEENKNKLIEELAKEFSLRDHLGLVSLTTDLLLICPHAAHYYFVGIITGLRYAAALAAAKEQEMLEEIYKKEGSNGETNPNT